jgi:D-sedoheptulose 7-phosphate isomerase
MLSDIEIAKAFEDNGAACLRAYRNQRKILVAGNGSIAADTQHSAGELVSRFPSIGQHWQRPRSPLSYLFQ